MDLQPLLESLKIVDDANTTDKALSDILKRFTDSKNVDEVAITMTGEGLLDSLLPLASTAHITKVAEILAEVAKTESIREPCVEKGFVPLLLRVLEEQTDVASMTQACRAMGNVCFDNDLGRSAVEKYDGIKTLLSLLQAQLSSKHEGADKLRIIACGFLLNLTNSNDVLQQAALEGGALEVMSKYLQHCQDEGGLCNMVLVTIASLTDSERCKEKLVACNLCSSLVTFLCSPMGDENYESVLDILIAVAEWDEVKDVLARTELCSHLIQLAQTNVQENAEYSEDNLQKVKMASDLLILLLTGEKSMEMLFGGGKGEIFKESLNWLDSDHEHLQLSGALAVGNFARSDEHCRFLVEHGVIQRLLRLLKPTYGEAKCTLEHAALSALRNLAIPAGNKTSLIKAGVIDAVLVCVDSEMLAVIFKILGVLRMLVDGQEEAALRLGQDREFITRLVEWSACEQHPGVKGEATRLLAWLIKNSRAEEVMRNIIRADGIPHLVSMTTSEHVVMQNEALVSLTLIVTMVLADAALPMKEADLSETICSLLQDQHTLPEILCNTLTLVRTILTSEHLRDDMLSSSACDAMRVLMDHSDEKVRQAASTVAPLLEDTTEGER
ncbi:rap1 GTPase-GDP dissociation stimulator 1-like isoform X3 [Dreissena polymorpha]|uniref:rap1 GTPase-GDP dissociation stimulator 1-like isoform X3 n=1 Tax=Dreissena polymorpha TaxID=45954 RepID=UPI002263BB5F|nr:rap1 GTPase-GDP dissociation stimulator 1-like isoform X3 [Dreissena polymorpha]